MEIVGAAWRSVNAFSWLFGEMYAKAGRRASAALPNAARLMAARRLTRRIWSSFDGSRAHAANKVALEDQEHDDHGHHRDRRGREYDAPLRGMGTLELLDGDGQGIE